MKILAMLKRQQFKNNGSDKKEVRGSKCQHLDECNNKEENGLSEDEGKIKGARYVFPPFIPLLLS